MEEVEIWGKVGILRGIDFSDSYEASTFGNVRSVDREVECKNGWIQKYKGPIISPYKNKVTGYTQVALNYNGAQYTFGVHEVVMSAHNPNPNPEIYTDINHIDEDKTNNKLNNLEWTTHKENVNYGTGIERRTQTRKNCFIPIVQLDFNGNIINVYYSIEEISETETYNIHRINDAISRQNCIYKDYFWIKLDEYNELTQQELINTITIKIIENKNNNKCKKVIQLSKDNEFIKEYVSIAAAAKEAGCTKQAMQQCVSGKQKTCKGYKWKYK